MIQMCDFFLLTDDSGVDIVVFWSGRSTPIYIYIYIYIAGLKAACS